MNKNYRRQIHHSNGYSPFGAYKDSDHRKKDLHLYSYIIFDVTKTLCWLTIHCVCFHHSQWQGVFFFLKTKIKNVNCIFTKTGKNNSQKGKEITEQMIFIDLMLNGLSRVNSLEVKLLTSKYHSFFIDRTTVQEWHSPLSYWVEFKVYACENLAS